MTTTCPNGHDSEWPDYCSVCGDRLGGADAAPVGSPSPSPASAPDAGSSAGQGTSGTAAPAVELDETCDNCGEPRRADDVFCESCGLDFLSGSLPQVGEDGGSGEAAAPASLTAEVTLDEDFFAASVGDVDLDLPDPRPEPHTIDLTGSRVLIGRHSESRGIFPEIDIEKLTDDPAVSSRHAMIERSDGGWILTDLGSTNGTWLSIDADDPIAPGEPVALNAGITIFLGAWTRIDIS